MGDTNYAAAVDQSTPDTDVPTNYGGTTSAGAPFSDDVLTARASRADFALGDKSPGVPELKDRFATQGEDVTRQTAAAQADNEFKQEKLAAVSDIVRSGVPLTPEHIDSLVNIGTTPEANPRTVFEDKFGKNFVTASVTRDPYNNSVFAGAFDKAPEQTQQATYVASAGVSKHQIAKGMFEETDAAYKNTSWFDTGSTATEDYQRGKLGSLVQEGLSLGISAAANTRSLVNIAPQGGSFLPGKNMFEQIEAAFLLPHDRFYDTVMAQAGPDSKLFHEDPAAARAFMKGVAEYSASDTFVDNLMFISNAASFVPMGAIGKGIGTFAGKGTLKAWETTEGIKNVEAAAKAAKNILSAPSKAPVTAGQQAVEGAFGNAQDVLSGSSTPPKPGYYVPKEAVTRQTLPIANDKFQDFAKTGVGPQRPNPSQTEARPIITSVGPNGEPIIQDENGAFIQLSRTPQEGHLPVIVHDEMQPTTTFTNKEGTFVHGRNAEGQSIVNGKRVYYVDKAGHDELSQVLEKPSERILLEKQTGGKTAAKTTAPPELPDTSADTALWKAGKITTKEWEKRLAEAYKPVQTEPSEVTGGIADNRTRNNLYVANRGGQTPGSQVPGTKLVEYSNNPGEGLYPITLPEGTEPYKMEHFGSKITRYDRTTTQKVSFGPEIVSQEVYDSRKALADTVKAAAEKSPQDALSKMGAHEEAATGAAAQQLNERFAQAVPQGAPKDVFEKIRQRVPSIFSPQTWWHNASSLSTQRANELAENAMRTSTELGAAMTDSQRVERLTQEAYTRAVNETKADFKRRYNRASDAILDQAPLWDSNSNTYYVVNKLGKKDKTLFDNRATAEFALNHDYKLADAGATVEQEGNQYYIQHIQHIDETKDAVRQGLIVSGNITPRGNMFTQLLDLATQKIFGSAKSIRSSAYTVSDFQHAQRVTATHAGSNLRKAVETAGEDLSSMSKAEHQELERLLISNRDYMSPEGVRGKFYDSALEFETAFNDMFQRMPSEKQIVAYEQYKRLSDLDWVLRELDWHRDKVRQGVRNFRVNFQKTDSDGIQRSADTDWFNAKPVDNFDPANKQNANVYIMPEGRLTTKTEMAQGAVRDLDIQQGIKDGKYKILQVYNPGSKPLQDATGVKLNIHFIVVDKYQEKAVQLGENSTYRPGGHVMYKASDYIKQANIGPGANGLPTWFGDTTLYALNSRKDGELVLPHLNEAREALRNNDEAKLKAVLDRGVLPHTLNEFKQLFTDGGASLSTEHPFVMTSEGRSTFDSDEAFSRANPGLRDTFSSYDLTATGDKTFHADRNGPINTLARSGTEDNPVFKFEDSKLFDPYTALQKSIGQIVRQRWMGDYKLQAAESWIQEFAHLFDQSKLPLERLRQNPVYWMMHAEGNIDLSAARVNPEMVAAAQISRKNILQFIGSRDDVGALADGYTRKLISMTESVGGKKAADFMGDRFLPGITNAAAYARAAAFHATTMFNPVQLFQQGQGMFHAIAVSPLSGLHGCTAATLARYYRYTEDATILSSMADKAAAMGWNRDNFVEAYNAWKSSGVHEIGGEQALLSSTTDLSLFKSAGKTFLDKGQLFFRPGEAWNRDVSWFAAYQDWRRENPALKLDNRAMGDIGNRFDTLSMNMTRASNAAYNEGILSIPTQFYTWNARFAEQMLGKQLTWAEKARAFTAYSAMYGIPATLGGASFGGFGITHALGIPTNYEDIRKFAMEHNINLNNKFIQAMSDGIPEMLTKIITGHHTDLQRFSPNANQINDIEDGKKSWYEVLGGASGGLLGDIMYSVKPALSYIMNAFKGGDSRFPVPQANDFYNMAERITAFSNAEKAWVAIHTGRYYTKTEGLVANDLDTYEGFLLALGLNPKRVSDTFIKSAANKDLTSMWDKTGKLMQEDASLALQAGARGDMKTYSEYMGRVNTLARMSNMTNERMKKEFKRFGNGHATMMDQVEDQWAKNQPTLRNYDSLKRYIENQEGKK